MKRPDPYWEQAHALFDAARSLPVEQRAAYLAAACPDVALRREVEDLLRAHASIESGAAAGFLAHLDARHTAVLLDPADTSGSEPDEAVAGETIGRYRIVRHLGRGGMGVVYLAEDLRLGRVAALKLLPRHLSVDAMARRRFEEEARAASALDHPNIVTVYEVGNAPDGRVFMAMAYCEGETLRDVLEAGPLPVERAVSIAAQIADGLAAAHRAGIVHRDIKPRNIIVTADGVAKVVDFGIARVAGSALTQTALTPGTVAYMSPEQTRSNSSDVRADVWALGVVLYEMLAGRRPFGADNEQAIVYGIRNDEPVSLAALREDVSAELVHIVDRCLCKDPDARYPDAEAVLLDLRRILLPAREPARPAVRFARLTATAATFLLVIAAAAFGVRTTFGPPQLEPRRVAVGSIENRSGSTELAEVAKMAGDWITHGLWQTGFIEVVPLASFGGEQDGNSARELARASGARLVVAGALYRDGAVLRLQAQITDALTGRLVGSVDPVNTPVAAPMEGVEELRHRVQAALYPQLDTQITHIQAVQRPPRFEAYSAYLAGRDSHGARDLPAALRHFQRAAELDSTFALPRVLSAVVMNMMGAFASADSMTRLLERDAADLDPFSRAHVDWLRGTLAGDRQATYDGMRAAARLAPGSTLVNYQLADETVSLGRPKEAIELLYSFEPERGELRGWFGYWQVLAAAHHLRGDHRRELREAQRARSLYTDDPRAVLAELRAYAALGRTERIAQRLAEIAERPPARGEPSPGALMLNTALELRVHAGARRGNVMRAAADTILERAIAWYRSGTGPEQSVRARYELTIALAAAGRRAEARQLLAELANAHDPRLPGPSPFASNRTPGYPDRVAYHGTLGVLAAIDGDTAAARRALTWLAAFRDEYARGRPAYWRAAVHAAQGERETAVALLRQSFAEGIPYSLALHMAPELEPLRGYAPFDQLMQPRD